MIIFDDPQNDVAILEYPQVLSNPLPVIDSDTVKIGNEVFTIGFPYDLNSDKTLTVGHVAALENGFIKIDTSVNNGNSGGPLFNKNGGVIGIVNTKLGRLSQYLETIENVQPRAVMSIGGIDPVSTIQQMIREMEKNLNLGIGYAIPSKTIAQATEIVKHLLVK